MYSGNCGPGTLVTTRLNSRWRACSRAAWAMIVGGAKPDSSVSTWAPTACPDSLIAVHRLGDRQQALHRVDRPDRQRRPHRRDAVTERAALDVGADRDRHHRPQDQIVGRLAVEAQIAAERTRHDRQHDVVDGPAERVLDRLELAQVAADPGEAAVGADPDVERARRRASAGPPGPSRRPRPPRGRRGRRPAAGRATSPARRGRSRPARWPAPAAHRRAAERCWAAGAGSTRAPAATTGIGSGEESNSTRGDVDAGDAVDERVVGLGQHREAVVGQALDQPQLPQRTAAVERLGEHAPGQPPELLLAPGLGQRRVADVEADVEVGIVDPHRPALVERHERQPLAVARHQMQPRARSASTSSS